MEDGSEGFVRAVSEEGWAGSVEPVGGGSVDAGIVEFCATSTSAIFYLGRGLVIILNKFSSSRS